MIAYEAVVALATIPLCCASYRTAGSGHHQTISLALPMGMGDGVRDLAAYFDTCRTKRNASAYDRVGGISEAEVSELLKEAHALQERVLAWLQANHPELIRQGGCRAPWGDPHVLPQ
jgi:hypothetical protein